MQSRFSCKRLRTYHKGWLQSKEGNSGRYVPVYKEHRNSLSVNEIKLKAQIAKDAEHDFRLNSVDSKNVEQDSELRRQRVKDSEHDSRLEQLEKLCADLTLRVEALESQVKALQK